jgi:hypothetical protein
MPAPVPFLAALQTASDSAAAADAAIGADSEEIAVARVIAVNLHVLSEGGLLGRNPPRD